MRVPHSWQNLWPATTSAPHDGHGVVLGPAAGIADSSADDLNDTDGAPRAVDRAAGVCAGLLSIGLTPTDVGFSQVRAAYNAMYPGKPALVVRPTGTADVMGAVNFARENGLLLAVRGGGHSIAGLSSVDGGLLLDLALIRQLGGDYARAEPELLEGLTLFRQVSDRSGEAHALNRLGFLATATGDLAEASERFSESLALWRAMGNQQMIAADLHNLGEARHLSGSLDEAEALYREALVLFDALGDAGGRGFALCHLGLLALDRGKPLEARELLLESLKLRWSAGLRGLASDTLEALAEATWRLGDLDFAATLIQTANLLRDETGVARQPVYEKRYQQIVKAVEAGSPITEPIDVDAVVATLTGSTPLATPVIR